MEPSTLFLNVPEFAGLPRIKASELHKRADAFATELVERLTRFNDEHREPMNLESTGFVLISPQEPVLKEPVLKEAVLGPAPSDFHTAFQVSFCRYTASRCVIVPD